ncbi:TetR/AcrR family transcriptional regulator [Nocardia sp. NBC_00416]|uniref:TetR/AcrR family transcriptional regulator n=1 Tax=Nocardia sp. NBC_00416 TaxID=2975991 RepID=UPI002E234693
MTRPLRRDAARNREKVLEAAAAVFTEQGLRGSLEEVARRAGVGIGTVYNHFPTRDALIDALLPARLAAVDEFAAASESEPDAWRAFTGFVGRLTQQMAADRGLLEAFTGDHPAAEQVAAACHRGMAQLSRLLERTRDAGALRHDVTDADVVHLIWALSLLGDAAGAEAVGRCTSLALDGLRAERQ